MSQPSWKSDADRQSSRWIDGDDGAQATDSPNLPSQAESAVQHYIADLLLVNALLANMADGAVDEREDRIRRVMDAVSDRSPVARPRTRFVRWPSFVAAAACLLVIVTTTWIRFGQNSLANEVLLAVHKVSLEATDRVYTIRRVTANGNERPHGRLYLRGRRGFVITCGEAVLGRNADQFWLVTPDQQVTLSDDFHWIDASSTRDELGLRIMQELSLESRHVPLMQLASVAELMQYDYDVKLTRGQLHDRTVDLLVGQRRSGRQELPATIRLWSGIDSRVIQRAELSWGRGNAIFLELQPDEPVPAEWYRYQTHCDGEPSVRRITSGA